MNKPLAPENLIDALMGDLPVTTAWVVGTDSLTVEGANMAMYVQLDPQAPPEQIGQQMAVLSQTVQQVSGWGDTYVVYGQEHRLLDATYSSYLLTVYLQSLST